LQGWFLVLARYLYSVLKVAAWKISKKRHKRRTPAPNSANYYAINLADTIGILFDEQFKPVAGGSGFDLVSATADAVKSHHGIVNISRNGYLYVYCSNESNIDVFFDNLQLINTRGPLTEETHYYPFGLTMAGISSKAAGSLKNKRKWNKGSELESKEFSDGSGLELYYTFYRSLDPQLGEFWQIDPKPDYAQSLYSSMNNNPISISDPLGDTAINSKLYEPKDASHATTLTDVIVIAPKKINQPKGLDGITIPLYNPVNTKTNNNKLGPGGLYIVGNNRGGVGIGTSSNGGDPQSVNLDVLLQTFSMVNRAGPLKPPDFSDPWDTVKLFGKWTKQRGADDNKVDGKSPKVIYSRESGINFVIGEDGIGYPGSADLKATDTVPKEKSDDYPHPIKN